MLSAVLLFATAVLQPAVTASLPPATTVYPYCRCPPSTKYDDSSGNYRGKFGNTCVASSIDSLYLGCGRIEGNLELTFNAIGNLTFAATHIMGAVVMSAGNWQSNDVRREAGRGVERSLQQYLMSTTLHQVSHT